MKNVDQPSEQALQFSEALGIDPIICQILLNRGYGTEQEMQDFLNPSPEQLHDPFLMNDMQRGVDRIETAIENGEKITVYGDYDTDGVTSTSIMFEALQTLGAQVDYFIPNRFKDGYGPNVAAFKTIVENGTTLIVTVDNGVSGHDAIAAANELNCDVVVTDHHELPETLPDAYAIIHPRYPGHEYPFGGLSGAGVAFKVATALLQEIPQEALDLVSIGTVADLVPLVGENRVLVYYGLQAITQTERPGLSALMKEAGINLETFNEQGIGFGIAPRLNALGRLNDATPAVELLTTFDDERASELAKDVESQNKERQALVKQISAEAEKQAENADNQQRQTLVISGENWHEGVLGIVASKIVEKTGKPTVVLNEDPTTGHAKGSGRSVDGFDLFVAFDSHRDLMVNFGGHEMAVGMTTTIANLDQVKAAFEQAAIDQKLSEQEQSQVKVAATLDLNTVKPDFYDLIKSLAPFGTDNPEPLFRFDPDSISSVTEMGADKSHLKFKLVQNGASLDAIAFGKGSLGGAVKNGPTETEIIGSLDVNVWRGRSNLQVMVRDILVKGIQIVDTRTSQLAESMFQQEGIYVFFHKKIQEQLAPFLKNGAVGMSIDEVTQTEIPEDPTILLVDCPDDLGDLKRLFAAVTPSMVITYFYKKRQISDLGMPDREQYAKLFKFVKTHQNVDIAHQSGELAKYLQIDQNSLIFMIQVFFEVGFLTVSDGIMNPVRNPQATNLKDAPSYQLREQQILTEKQLLQSDTTSLKSWLQAQIV